MSRPQHELPQNLTISDLADYLAVPVDTIYGWRTKGYGPPGIKVGRHLRYRRRDVEDWLESQSTAAPGPSAGPGSSSSARRRNQRS